MCGRFVSTSGPEELAAYFSAQPAADQLEPDFNVAPTKMVYSVAEVGGHRSLISLRWGLVPFWAKDLKIGSRMINARSETVASKPAFRAAFARRRCLIPMDGFFEWAKVSGIKAKQPYYITATTGDPLVVAGIWETWSSPDGGEAIRSCSLLTCDANSTMSQIHHRMPVFLPPTQWDSWLDPTAEVGELGSLLQSAPDNLLTLTPISDRVNNVRNQGPDLTVRASAGELIDPSVSPTGSGPFDE